MHEYGAAELKALLQRLPLSYPVSNAARDRLWSSITGLLGPPLQEHENTNTGAERNRGNT